MKKKGILNSQLMSLITKLGHTDTFLIADAGMPIPDNVEVVELILTDGIPTFNQVLNAIIEEVEIEGYFVANETKRQNLSQLKFINKHLYHAQANEISHEDLKIMSRNCKFAIKTGEHKPYANIILSSGVTF